MFRLAAMPASVGLPAWRSAQGSGSGQHALDHRRAGACRLVNLQHAEPFRPKIADAGLSVCAAFSICATTGFIGAAAGRAGHSCAICSASRCVAAARVFRVFRVFRVVRVPRFTGT